VIPGSTIILALSALVPGGELHLVPVLAAAVAGVPKAARDTGEVAAQLDTLAQNLASDADNLQRSVNTLLARLAA